MSVLDTAVLSDIQRLLIETDDGGLTFSSGLWTPAEVIDYSNQRQRRFLLETGVVWNRRTLPIIPQVHQHPLPERWMGTQRAIWKEQDPLANGLVSFWPLNEASGTRFDVIGNNHLTPYIVDDPGGALPASTLGLPGFSGLCAFLDSSLQTSLRIKDADSHGSLNPLLGDFSISLWANLTGLQFAATGGIPYFVLVGKNAVSSGVDAPGYNIGAPPISLAPGAAQHAFSVIGTLAGGRGGQFSTTATFSLNAWHHVVVTYTRAGDMRVYVDYATRGKPFTAFDGSSCSKFGDTTATCSTDAAFGVGCQPRNLTNGGPKGQAVYYTTGYFNGVGYWARALQDDEVLRLYNNGQGLIPPKYRYVEVPRSDAFEHDHLSPTWARDFARPTGYGDGDTPTLVLRLMPAPLSSGELLISTVEQPENNLANTGVAYGIPDDMVPTVKWGILSDMLSKVGRGQDLQRAAAAEQLWEQGVQASKILLQGFI